MRDFAVYHGGLGLSSTSDVRLQKVARTVQFSLEKQGYSGAVTADLTAHQVQITCSACVVHLKAVPCSMAEDPDTELNIFCEDDEDDAQAVFDVGCRIEIKLSDCVAGDAESLLAFLMIDLVRTHTPACVEWLDRKTTLPSDDFLACFEMRPQTDVVMPKRPVLNKPARRFASVRAAAKSVQSANPIKPARFVPLTNGLDWSHAQVALAQAYRIPTAEDAPVADDDTPSDALRLATWAISGVIAFIALPVAVSLFIINLLRGEDFRLNTQALSITGLMVVLQANGALADVIALLPY